MIEAAVAVGDSSAAEGAPFRAVTYIKWAYKALQDGVHELVGAYGGSSVRKSYIGKDWPAIVACRDNEHERQLAAGKHHCWKLQRLKNKDGHHVTRADIFIELV